MSKYQLKITLKSDICPGSGYAFAGLIDSDVCFDDHGIPYIPGRRLKGCFKESADMLKENGLFKDSYLKEIFGKTGDDKSGSLLVSNAYIEGYECLCRDLEKIRTNKQTSEMPVITRQQMLEQFTSIKAQTKMEDGVALDDTLRYTRTVNRYSPLNGDEITFIAEISLDDRYKDDFEKTVKATRHIGMDRNRGLGSVVCKIDDMVVDNIPELFESNRVFDEIGTDDKVTIKIHIKNTAPLMISGDNDEVSLNYIPAQNVIGCLAGRYLQKNGYGPEFERLFLDGTTCYSNLYVEKEGDDNEYIPAPSFVNKLKKTGKYVNILQIEKKDGLSEQELLEKKIHPVYASADKKQSGNMPKKQKGKYVTLSKDPGSWPVVTGLAETEMFIDYHHTKKGGRSGDESILYTNQVIKEGQFFSGTITTKGKDLADKLKELLMEDMTLRFGKSKSAQYGSCILVKAVAEIISGSGDDKNKDNTEERNGSNTEKLKSGDVVMVSLMSDGIFMNARDYTVKYDEVRDTIAKAMEMENCVKADNETDEKLFSFVTTGITFGYNTKWNLRKQPVPVIAAGSTFVFEASKDCTIKIKPVGERVHEGFGRVKVFKNIGYDMNPSGNDNNGNGTMNPGIDTQSGAAELIRNIITKELLKQLPPVKRNFEAESAQLGRITLMLKECKNGNGFNDTDFCERIENIKSDDTRLKIKSWLIDTKMFKMTGGKLEKKDNHDDFGWDDEALRLFESYEKNVDDQEFRKNFIEDNMYKILMEYLTNEKYLKKINEKSDEPPEEKNNNNEEGEEAADE